VPDPNWIGCLPRSVRNQIAHLAVAAVEPVQITWIGAVDAGGFKHQGLIALQQQPELRPA